MFTNQKILTVFLILFVIGASVFFAFTKFKQEVNSVTASPSPSPSPLDFLLTKTPAPTAVNNQTQSTSQPTSQPTELPLEKNKRLTQFPGVLTDESLGNKKAVIQTNKGTIQIQIFPETKLASSNFMILAAKGFYNGLTFHRVEDWVVQGGDPEGTGRGGPGYQFNDEPVNRSYVRGIVAMANAGPNTNGSQFFILKRDYPLEPQYTIFGQVISGIDVVDNLSVSDVIQKAVVQNLQ
ncbi:peptidylprolyl isomerase [Candidatus Daviesbacteria bacterium]|nr:peptidylprolyl isomerase [Candidatus Daviesbacteria bacterium]